MKKAKLNEFIGKNVEIIFFDNDTKQGILSTSDIENKKAGYMVFKPNYYFIGDLYFKCSYVKKVKVLKKADLEFIEKLIRNRKEIIEEDVASEDLVDYAKKTLIPLRSIKKKLLAWNIVKENIKLSEPDLIITVDCYWRDKEEFNIIKEALENE